MTDQELQLQHDRVSAEIAKLIAETSNFNTQNIHLATLTQKTIADMKKTTLETKWYLPVIASGATFALIAATATLVKLFL